MLKSTPEAKRKESPDKGLPSLRTLFESEESTLLRFAYSLTGRRAVAEEIVQEIFLQLHARWKDVQEPRAWLYRSVRNEAFEYLRKSRRETNADDNPVHFMCSDDETPEQLMAHMETVAELQQLIGALPEKDRKLVQLKYYEGLKYRDISERTGLTISNVGFRLHQVLKKLAASLLHSEIEDKS